MERSLVGELLSLGYEIFLFMNMAYLVIYLVLLKRLPMKYYNFPCRSIVFFLVRFSPKNIIFVMLL